MIYVTFTRAAGEQWVSLFVRSTIIELQVITLVHNAYNHQLPPPAILIDPQLLSAHV